LAAPWKFYDFVIFFFFTRTFGQLFFPPEIPDWLRQFQTFGIFAVGYFVRPLGGIVVALSGDRLGRKRMFTVSILMMTSRHWGWACCPSMPSMGSDRAYRPAHCPGSLWWIDTDVCLTAVGLSATAHLYYLLAISVMGCWEPYYAAANNVNGRSHFSRE
jgi:MFS family permease